MCDYSSFSSIDKFPFLCVARSRVAMPAPQGRLPSALSGPHARTGSNGHCQGAAGSRAPPLSGPCSGSLGATLTTKKLKSIVSSVNRLLFFSIYLPWRSGPIFTIKLESVEHGCCTNIYISADHSLIAALGENNIPSSVTPVWRPESRSRLQSRDRRSPCVHVQSHKLISSDVKGQRTAFSSGPTVLWF